MKKIQILIILSLLCGCSAGANEASISIMSWNVENFFDDVDNGSEYYEYDPGNGNWDYDCFTRKAAAIADVVTSSVSGGPDIVLLQEVENLNALEHLNTNYLKALEYPFVCFFPTENSAIGNAILSKFEITSVNNHSVYVNGFRCGRNIAEAQVSVGENGEKIVIFINHWKSKLGGAEETEQKRIAASILLKDLVSSFSEDESTLAVIAAGDFNESYDESIRVLGDYETAIAFDNTESGVGDVISIGDIEKIKTNTSILYNPWIDAECKGSYCYNGSWETIDQFFLDHHLFDNTGVEYSFFETVSLDFNTTKDGYPLSWDNSSDTGCSDHFPIMLGLVLLQ